MNQQIKNMLAGRPKLLRSAIARGLAASDKPVDPKGGDNASGIIRGMAILTRGEALGHGLWCDRVMLSQCRDAINAAGSKGMKARFTHPDLSGDGLGKYTGRVKNAYLDGDTVRGDLHFSATAHNTPDGNLAGYMLELAAEDPEAFGNSIAFREDWEAEDKFIDDNRGEKGRFKSPDPANVNNFPHARIAELQSVDAVDEPAANPGGLFHRGDEIARDAESLASYALGLSSDRPTLCRLDFDPDRIGGFIQRFFARNGLTLRKGEMEMPLSKFTAGIATQLAEDKDSREDEKERVGEEEGDADKDEDKDKGKKEGQGDFSATASSTQLASDEGDGDDEEKKKEMDDEEDDEKKKLAAAKLAKGGEAPGDASGTAAIEKEKQETEEEVAEDSKKPAKKGSGVESPGSDKSAVGPMGDASHNVGYSQAREDAKKFHRAFGNRGLIWFAEGKTFAQAQELHVKQLAADNVKLAKENEELKTKLTGKRGLPTPLNAGGETSSVSPEQQKLANNVGGGGLARFAVGIAAQLQPSRN